MFSGLSKVLGLLSRRERFELMLLAPAVVVMGILEVAGVASIIPFLGLLSDPEAIDKHASLRWFYEAVGFADQRSFFFAVGLGVLILVTVGNTFSAFTTWALLRFSWMRNHSLSMRLLDRYLRKPYEFFLGRNSAELSNNILSEVQQAVSGVIVHGLELLARMVVITFIIAAIVLVDPAMALSLIVLFGGVYGLLYWMVRRKLTVMGAERKQAQKDRFKLASEVLGGIKEIKLLGLEETLLDQYGIPSHRFADAMASSKVLSLVPKFALETVAFGGVLVIVLYWLWRGNSLHDVLPLLGIYAFAAYRILPGLQTVFAALATIRFNVVVVDSLAIEIGPEMAPRSKEPVEPIPFEHSVKLDQVIYCYPTGSRPALGETDLEIMRSEWVALVGPTGAGKSTLVDVVLGLLRPTSGTVQIDGSSLDEDMIPGWQKNVGYVPQQIFLIDDTVTRNIAFGIAPEDVDLVALRAAARTAQIDEFITSELPSGYDTVVGERGVRLSGGQRQRIGIARSLYRRPALLILDEATSAVDGPTEAAFFEDLRRTMRSTTVISIAHRLSTTKQFDRVLLLERGSIVATGSPDDAIGGHGSFALLHTTREEPSTISA